MTAWLTYVYCLVRSRRAPSVRDVPAGVPGSRNLRTLDAGNQLRAVVADVPAADYDEATLARGLQALDWVGARAMRHEAVVEHFLGAPAVLPMTLFTLFTSDERALAHVARERKRIDRILGRIDRQLEWGLRLTFDEAAARQTVEDRHVSRTPRTRGIAPGTAYLARKRDLFDVTRVQLTAARAEATRLYRELSREATDARRRTSTERAAPGSRLLLDAAFLVPARRTAAFRSALRRQARSLTASGIVVSLTGPWPPYNFLDSRSLRRRGGSRSRSSRTG